MNNSNFEEMSFDRFLENLPKLDWFYNYSDDGDVYERGRRLIERYLKLAEYKGPEWFKAFVEERHRAELARVAALPDRLSSTKYQK